MKVTNKKGQPSLVNFKSEPNTDEAHPTEKSIKIRLIDMGGHQEYYCCSSLFFSTSGLFLICFKSILLASIKDTDDDYYGNVGTFVDLVSQTSSKSGMKLKIALVATQSESLEEESSDLFASCERLLEVTRNHLASLSSDLFFLNEVMMTSSKNATKDALEDLHSKVAAMCCDPQLKVTSEELRPMSWHKFLATVSQSAHMTLENAQDFWAKEKEEVGETTNITSDEVETLQKFQIFVKAMIEEAKSRKAKPAKPKPVLVPPKAKNVKGPAEEKSSLPSSMLEKAPSLTKGIASENGQDEKNNFFLYLFIPSSAFGAFIRV